MTIHDLSRTAGSTRRMIVATVIRIFPEDGSCHEFNLADFGGQLPSCGDSIIMPPSVLGEQATPGVWQVVARLFDPGRAFDAGSSLRLVVRSRAATAEEIGYFR